MRIDESGVQYAPWEDQYTPPPAGTVPAKKKVKPSRTPTPPGGATGYNLPAHSPTPPGGPTGYPHLSWWDQAIGMSPGLGRGAGPHGSGVGATLPWEEQAPPTTTQSPPVTTTTTSPPKPTRPLFGHSRWGSRTRIYGPGSPPTPPPTLPPPDAPDEDEGGGTWWGSGGYGGGGGGRGGGSSSRSSWASSLYSLRVNR